MSPEPYELIAWIVLLLILAWSIVDGPDDPDGTGNELRVTPP